jgi:hypothetical protein
MPITYRLEKGTALTNEELDNNFRLLVESDDSLQTDINTLSDEVDDLEQTLLSLIDGKQDLNDKLTSLSNNTTDGFLVLNGSDVLSRSIVAGSSAIVITNGTGVSGNTSINVGESVVQLTATQTLTNKVIYGSTNTIRDVSLVESVTGKLAIANGGTNATTAQEARSNLGAMKDSPLNGIVVRLGSGETTGVSIAASGVGLSITNGSGVGGNPTVTSNATSANTTGTIVARDGSGNFSAGTITASLNGNATSADTVTNGVYTTGSYSNPSWITSLAGSKVTSIPNSSLQNSTITINGTPIPLGGSTTVTFDGVSSNTPNTIVKRDGSGNFSAGTITGNLNGNATTAATATLAVTATNGIYSTTQPPGTANTTIATTAFVSAAFAAYGGSGLGIGQTWQNVKNSRNLSTDYTNTTNKPIAVSIVCNPGTNAINGFVDNINITQANSTSSFNSGMFMIVPPGSTYKVTSNMPITIWAELR